MQLQEHHIEYLKVTLAYRKKRKDYDLAAVLFYQSNFHSYHFYVTHIIEAITLQY